MLIPTVALLCVMAVLVATFYRAGSILSSVQEISTPPPLITDNTFEEELAVGATPAPQIQVDTAPARAVLEKAYTERSLPKPSEDGTGSRLLQLSDDVQDITGGAAVASGIKDGSSEGFTLLVMGVDAQPGAAIDIGVRPDVLMLVRFDPAAKSCQMLSIPRDTRVQLPGYGQSKINHALMVGGIPYQLLVTEDYIGEKIDHYVLVDYVAFGQIVDALGGVQVTVPEDLERNDRVEFTKGTHLFDGEQALLYARFRTASGGGDLDRIQRQWSMFSSMANKAQNRDVVNDVDELLPTVEDHIRTDLTATEMADLAKTYGKGCLQVGKDTTSLLRGARAQFEDPILTQVLYYNVVSPVTLRAKIDELYGIEASERGDLDKGGRFVAGLVLDAHTRIAYPD